MSVNTIQSKIQDCLSELLAEKSRPTTDVSPEVDLLEASVLDSFDFIALIEALSEKLERDIDLEDLLEDGDLSIKGLAQRLSVAMER